MDNTMKITIPWKPGMTVMLKDGRSEPDESAIQFLAEHGVGLERIEGGFLLGRSTLPYTTKHIANVYDGDDFEDLKRLAADGHQVEIEKGGVLVNGHNTLNSLVVEYLDR